MMRVKLLPNENAEISSPSHENEHSDPLHPSRSAWELFINDEHFGAWQPNTSATNLARNIIEAWGDRTGRRFTLKECSDIRKMVEQIHHEWREERGTAESIRRTHHKG